VKVMLKSQSSLSLCSRGRNVMLAAVAGAALSWPQIGAADSAGPFAKFLGSWRGSGQVTSTSGAAERISCRATYTGSENGAGLSQTLVCASDSYRFDVRGYVVAEGQSVQGHWQEMSRNVAGHIVGRISDGGFEGTIAGLRFAAEMSIRSSNRRQTVVMRPRGGDIDKVDIILSRES
jgi:hypothetical protein